MIAVIFEVWPVADGGRDAYLGIAAELRKDLEQIDGFISVERFQSLVDPDKKLTLSFFRDEGAVLAWRNLEKHRTAQKRGRGGVFANYRLRVASDMRDYGLNEREQAPGDSRHTHGEDRKVTLRVGPDQALPATRLRRCDPARLWRRPFRRRPIIVRQPAPVRRYCFSCYSGRRDLIQALAVPSVDQIMIVARVYFSMKSMRRSRHSPAPATSAIEIARATSACSFAISGMSGDCL